MTTPRAPRRKSVLPDNIEETLERISLVRINHADNSVIDTPYTAVLYRTTDTPQPRFPNMPQAVEIAILDAKGKVVVTTQAPGRGEAMGYVEGQAMQRGLYIR